MMKAVKECMRNWVMAHKRLYWYIVIGIAALAFGIITGMGCAKLEKAEAATESGETSITVTWYDEVQTMDLLDWQYYFIAEGGSIRGGAWVVYSNAPLVRSSSGTMRASDGSKIGVFGNTDKPLIWDTYSGLTDSSANGDSFTTFRANHDIYNEDGSLWLANSVISEMYSLDAPYTNFQRAVMRYGYEAKVFSDFYDEWMTNTSWTYFGHLNNMQVGVDGKYQINPTFSIQLPTVDYVLDLLRGAGVDISVDDNLGLGDFYTAIKALPDLINTWNYNRKAPYRVFEFQYVFELQPDENGNFVYSLTLSEFETLLRYFNADFLQELNGYSTDFRALYMTFMHIWTVTSTVETERADSIVYGKVTTNQFDRGIYNVCLEVIPEIDINTATPEEMDKILSDAYEDAHNQYIKDLEDRVDSLENQLGGMTSVDGAFGNLEGSDLWTGFVSLVSGIASIAPAISALSTLTGAVFGFLPITITGIMSTTLFAICIIAIIKAIRG